MRGAIWIIAAVALAGCTTTGFDSGTSSVDDTPVTVAEVQRAVACEFSYALSGPDGEGRQAIASWSALVELSLGVKDSHNVVSGLGSMTAKVGNGTLAATSPSMTFDGYVEDKNTLAYVTKIAGKARNSTCPRQGSPLASNGLGLAELLAGTVQIIDSGGEITSSSSIITSAGIGPSSGAVVLAGTVLPVATVQEKIPTVKFERSFTVSRKAGGGLSFKVGDISLSLTGSGIGRERKDNKITVTMGMSSAPLSSTEQADLSGPIEPGGVQTLQGSIFEQRTKQLDALRGLTPNEVIVVNPAAVP